MVSSISIFLHADQDEAVEVIPECPTNQIYTKDQGCHVPSPCEKLELNLYRDNGQIGCYLIYKIEPYLEIEKGCIPLRFHTIEGVRLESLHRLEQGAAVFAFPLLQQAFW